MAVAGAYGDIIRRGMSGDSAHTLQWTRYV